MEFTYNDGHLYCESVKVKDIQKQLEQNGIHSSSPIFIYSKKQLLNNIQAYKEPLDRLPNDTSINYSMKANSNPHLLKIIQQSGCSSTLVSGNELRLALMLGFSPKRLMLNGNGKCRWESQLAIESGCFINIDSACDLRQTIDITQQLGIKVNILLRVNFNIDANVHPYVNTGMAGSKFGIDEEKLVEILDVIKSNSLINMAGLHCHLGSTIEDLAAIRLCMMQMKRLSTELNTLKYVDIKYINIGGGLNIDYFKHADETKSIDQEDLSTIDTVDRWIEQLPDNGGMKKEMGSVHQCYKDKLITRFNWIQQLKATEEHFRVLLPECLSTKPVPSPRDLIGILEEVNFDKSISIIVEPGRSIIGDTAILLSTVLSCKESGNVRYITTTGSMTEVIRPSLYGSYHHINLTEPSQLSSRHLYNVVGPVCESSDFLGKNRFLMTPHVGCGIAVWDAGAYCSSMSSNYNLRPRAAEVLVDGAKWKLFRKPDTLEEMMFAYNFQHL